MWSGQARSDGTGEVRGRKERSMMIVCRGSEPCSVVNKSGTPVLKASFAPRPRDT